MHTSSRPAGILGKHPVRRFAGYVVVFVDRHVAGSIERRYQRINMHYLLFYEVVEGYAERRQVFRAAHLEHARRAVTKGELVLGGAFVNPVDGAVLLFRGSSAAVAEGFAAADPYVTNGLVTNWRVREWTTVVGADATVRLPDV